MCGFVAVFDPAGRGAFPTEALERMCDVIRHRGPDASGVYVDDWVALGHRRLSVIDLSDKANQPMAMDGCVLVHNGEIYNYLELREELQDRAGAEFTTDSDSEVIIRSYIHEGPECVRKFNGMFSFILWDSTKNVLFVARDRLGVKPLFFIREGGKYMFASDLKSIWEAYPPGDRIDPAAVWNFLDQGFISEPEASTCGVSKFPPGHYLCLDGHKESETKYWDLNAVEKSPTTDFNEAVERTEVLLTDALELRLRSDVPVGCFVSGGVDSSLVSALTAAKLGKTFHAYSIGFDSASHDESQYVKSLVQRYGIEHHHETLTSECLEFLPHIVWSYAELFGDSSAVPTYFVSKNARRELTVVLTGDGADEAFGGYVDPYAVYLSEWYKRRVPGPLRAMVRPALKLLGRRGSALRWANRVEEISRQSGRANYVDFKRGAWHGTTASDSAAQASRGGITMRHFDQCTSGSEVDRFLYADLHDRLAYDFLVKVDMATMAHSLEARSPFLDYRVVEWGYSLSHPTRYKSLRRKAVLKAVAEKYVDPKAVHRRKMGFTMPQGKWLREPKWQPIVSEIIRRPSVLDEYLPRDAINAVVSRFNEGSDADATRVWLLLWFQLWDGLFVSKVYGPDEPLSSLAR